MVSLRHLVAVLSLVVALSVNAVAWEAQAQMQNSAGLVVQLADGSLVTRCVSFSEESISGYELLRRAGLPLVVEVGGMGPAVCKIGNTGCNFPQQGCFCQCNTLDASCTYWTYAQIKDGAWRPSPLGAAGSKVRNGDVDGWRWGKGDGTTGENPPEISFEAVCSAQPASQPATTTVKPTVLQPTTAMPTALPAGEPAISPASTAIAPSTETPSPLQPTAATNPSQPTVTTTSTQPAPTVTPSPQPTLAPQSSPETDNDSWPLLGFGAIALLLVIGFAVVRRRGGA